MKLPFRQNTAARFLPVAALLAALLAFRLPADESVIQRIARQVGEYYATARPETVYLHLDRPVYGTGETIWFSGYVLSATQHQPDSLSRVLYVELLSPQQRLVARRTLRVVAGRAFGDIALPDSLPAGTYLLRAYTNWQRNGDPGLLYSRRLAVWPAALFASAETAAAPARKPAPAPDVQFFPEGGALIETLPAVVAYKATDASGRGLAVHGQILDGQNQVVVPEFSSQHLGMGHFALTPAPGLRYHAHLTFADGHAADYPLPAAQASGYALHITDAGEHFTVEARFHGAAGATSAGPLMLLSEVHGFLVYLGQRNLGAADAPATWRVPKAKYPNGILHLTLFDGQGTPQAERLAFILNGAPAWQATIKADQASYAPRRPVTLAVRVADASGQPVAARLSLAVAEAGIAALDPDAETVVSRLLLTADLAGYVEQPGYYFRAPAAEAAAALDDLLLTQGWRRFVWKEVLAGQVPPPLYNHEQALALTGQVVSEYGHRPIANSPLIFMQSKPKSKVLTANAGPDGRFRFSGFTGLDTVLVTLQARRVQGGSNVLIRPDAGPPTPLLPLPGLPPVAMVPPAVADYLRRSRQQQAAEHELNPEAYANSVALGNVAVTAKREPVAADDPRRIPGATPTTTVNIADIPAAQSGLSLLQLLQGRVAGLTVTGFGPDASVSIRGQGEPLLILDGLPTTLDVIEGFPASAFEAMEVFKGADAAIFGGRTGGGGALAIYTKRGNPNFKNTDPRAAPGVATFRLASYYRAREFYQPRYGAPIAQLPGPDPRRTTLYWHPTLQTDANGTAEIRFFTADAGGSFQAVVEGVSADGQPVRGVATVVARAK